MPALLIAGSASPESDSLRADSRTAEPLAGWIRPPQPPADAGSRARRLAGFAHLVRRALPRR
jgi:hypothetical protein